MTDFIDAAEPKNGAEVTERGSSLMAGSSKLTEFEKEGLTLVQKPLRDLTTRQKVATILSLVISPNLTGPVAYIAFLLELNVPNFWAWAFAGIYVFGLNPLVLPVLLAIKKKGDIYITDRRMRFWPLVWALAGYLIFVFFAGTDLGWRSFPVLFLIGSIVLMGVIILISLVWKVSIHMTGNGASFCALAFLNPISLAFTLPVHGFVAWGRYEMRAHTLLQLLAGSLLGFGIPLGVILLLL